MKKLTISIDFDGVLNDSEYPEIGEIDSGKIRIIRDWIDRGHTVIFNSCRPTDIIEKVLKPYFMFGRACYSYFNSSTHENIEKFGDETRKIYADVYIDDHNILQIGQPIDFEEYDNIIRRIERGDK